MTQLTVAAISQGAFLRAQVALSLNPVTLSSIVRANKRLKRKDAVSHHK